MSSLVGGVYMTQRHCQGCSSESDDLENSSSLRISQTETPVLRARTWIEVIENVIWLASAAFIVYVGDCDSNLISLLWEDERIKRRELYLGLLCAFLNVVVILYTPLFSWDIRRADEKLEIPIPSTAPTIIILGLLSFSLLSSALWPIWSFLTLPLLFTLFMAFLVTSPYLSMRTFQPEVETWRTD